MGCIGSLGELEQCQRLRRSGGVVGRCHVLGYLASNHSKKIQNCTRFVHIGRFAVVVTCLGNGNCVVDVIAVPSISCFLHLVLSHCFRCLSLRLIVVV